MPQITLEHTTNVHPDVPWSRVLAELHDRLAVLADTAVENCKGRAIQLDEYRLGGTGVGGFVHLTIRLFAGRSPELKQALGRAALDLLREHLTPSPGKLELTVEVQDIPRDLYFKARE